MWFYLLTTKDILMAKVWGKTFYLNFIISEALDFSA